MLINYWIIVFQRIPLTIKFKKEKKKNEELKAIIVVIIAICFGPSEFDPNY